MRKRIFILSLCVALVLGLGLVAGCRKLGHVTNLPQNVTEQEVKDWYAATGALQVIGEYTDDATKAIIKLRGLGLFKDDARYQLTLTSLGRVSQAGIHARNILNQSPNHFGESEKAQIRGLIESMEQEIQKANTEGLTGLNSDDAKAINTTIQSIDGAVQIILAMVRSQS